MPQFVTLVRYTQQGMSTIKESPARLYAAKKAAEAVGGKVLAWYLTMGQYSVTGAGVSFTQAGSDQSSVGTFINGSNETNLQATNLPGFSFTFTYSNPAGNVTAGGVFSYSGTSQQAERALQAAGFQHYSADEYDILHPSSLTYHAVDFRSAGDPGTGAHAGHFTVKEPWGLANPFTALGPATGDLHLGEHNNNTPGGFWPHTQEVINTFRDKLGLY